MIVLAIMLGMAFSRRPQANFDSRDSIRSWAVQAIGPAYPDVMHMQHTAI